MRNQVQLIIKLMIISIIGQLYLLFLLIGLGFLFSKLFRINNYSLLNLTVRGFAVLLVFLYVFHQFIPINGVPFIIISATGLAGLILFPNKSHVLRSKDSQYWLFILTLLMVLSSLYSSTAVEWYDSLLYHIQAVEWADLNPIVRGIGAIHHRLAFNNSIFLIDAFTEVGPLQNASFAIRNAFLLSLTIFVFLKELISNENKKQNHNKAISIGLLIIVVSSMIGGSLVTNILAQYGLLLGYGLLIVLILNNVFTKPMSAASIFSGVGLLLLLPKLSGGEINSLSTDYAVYMLTFMSVFLIFKSDYYDSLLLSVFTVTIKLTTWPLLAVSLMLVIYKNRLHLKKLLFIPQIWLSVIMLALWQLSGLQLSGSLLYPSLPLVISADWSMSPQHITDVKESVLWWARYPGMHHDVAKELGNKMWLERSISQYLSSSFIVFTIMGLVFLAAFYRPKFKDGFNLILLLFLPLSFIAFVFQTPDVRLTGLWIIIIFLITLVFLFQSGRYGKYLSMIGLLLLINPFVSQMLSKPKHIALYPEYPKSGVVELLNSDEVSTLPITKIYTPVEGDDKCGFAPLPCVLKYDVENYSSVTIDFEENQVTNTKL